MIDVNNYGFEKGLVPVAAMGWPQFCDCLRASPDESGFGRSLAAKLYELGFEEFIFTPSGTGRRIEHLTHSGSEFLAFYFREDLLTVDPIYSTVRHTRYPVPWDAEVFLRACRDEREGTLWRGANEVGFRSGVSVPLHGPTGLFDHLVCISHRPSWQDSIKLTRIVDEALCVGTIAAAIYHELHAPEREDVPNLTSRERECLAWTAAGKTAPEIGLILNISTRTAHFHLQNATHKLNAATKHQATLKAERLGLLLTRIA